MIENLYRTLDGLSAMEIRGTDTNLINLLAAKNVIKSVVNELNQPEEQAEQPTEKQPDQPYQDDKEATIAIDGQAVAKSIQKEGIPNANRDRYSSATVPARPQG